jgi:hypothetical protein
MSYSKDYSHFLEYEKNTDNTISICYEQDDFGNNYVDVPVCDIKKHLGMDLLEQENTRLKSLLIVLEWVLNGTCPICFMRHEQGHSPDCKLYKEIKEDDK